MSGNLKIKFKIPTLTPPLKAVEDEAKTLQQSIFDEKENTFSTDEDLSELETEKSQTSTTPGSVISSSKKKRKPKRITFKKKKKSHSDAVFHLEASEHSHGGDGLDAGNDSEATTMHHEVMKGSDSPIKTSNTGTLEPQVKPSKKDKSGIKIQDLPNFISDLKSFISDMKRIKCHSWKHKKASVNTIGSSIKIWQWAKTEDKASTTSADSTVTKPYKSVKVEKASKHSPEKSLSKSQLSEKESLEDELYSINKTLKAVIPGQASYVCCLPRCKKEFFNLHKFKTHLRNHTRIRKSVQDTTGTISKESGSGSHDGGISETSTPHTIDLHTSDSTI